ncbi:MAG TPA: hypothetical protein VGG71_15075 [Chitinophagaceae bacterium]|jgi:hypothetical protein
MQISIPRKELINFKNKAVNIETNTTIPILEFIKIEIENAFCTIVKDNLKAFVINEFPDTSNDECSFLVNENTLYKFLDFSESRFILFEQGVNQIKISDDYSSVESSTERPQNFRMPDLYPTTWTKLTRDTLDSIGIVSKIIFSTEIDGQKSNVYIGDGHVAGTDGIIGYCGNMVEKMPNIVLSKNIAGIVSKLKYCQYSYSDDYDYFGEDLITYGFLRNKNSFFDYAPLFGNIEGDYSFYIHKKSLITFCDLCIKVVDSRSEFFPAIFYSENGKLILAMEGSDKIIINNLPMNKDVKRFKFNPARMAVLLKALPCETVYFYPGEDRYLVTDLRKTFTAVIMGMR